MVGEGFDQEVDGNIIKWKRLDYDLFSVVNSNFILKNGLRDKTIIPTRSFDGIIIAIELYNSAIKYTKFRLELKHNLPGFLGDVNGMIIQEFFGNPNNCDMFKIKVRYDLKKLEWIKII